MHRGILSDFIPAADATILPHSIVFPHRDAKMSELAVSESMLKRALKEVLVEVLEERREYLRDVIEEVLQDFELIEDVREVKKVDRLQRSVFVVHEGEA